MERQKTSQPRQLPNNCTGVIQALSTLSQVGVLATALGNLITSFFSPKVGFFGVPNPTGDNTQSS
jgi:hypothetical protein